MAAIPGVPMEVLRAALEAVASHPAVIRSLAAALAADRDALTVGAPPVVGRLVTELRARGVELPEPVCARCARTGKPLTRSSARGCMRPLPTPTTGDRLCALRCGQTRRRPRRAEPADLRAVR
ncbi:hypothetical protein [Mycobacterium riyadhense]|uniref:hypothetical protein n=1 Tax=Mycobacterium riyadhense TaxID=486698 RepID=UPI00194DEC20|nr:hypothetical protein [Mycobacterium riyadhense]